MEASKQPVKAIVHTGGHDTRSTDCGHHSFCRMFHMVSVRKKVAPPLGHSGIGAHKPEDELHVDEIHVDDFAINSRKGNQNTSILTFKSNHPDSIIQHRVDFL